MAVASGQRDRIVAFQPMTSDVDKVVLAAVMALPRLIQLG